MAIIEIMVAQLGRVRENLDLCRALLCADEVARADRFLREADRLRFIGSHAALRVALGATLDVPPTSLRFGTDRTGRPYLPAPTDSGIDFNLSHSGDIALIGLSRGSRIGVDVEVHRPLPDALRIARTHFSPDEVAALANRPAHRMGAAFFSLWTRKEAVVKAMGDGLWLPLDRFSVTVPPDPPAVLRIDAAHGGWTLAGIDVGQDAAATVAVRALEADIRSSGFPAPWCTIFGAK